VGRIEQMWGKWQTKKADARREKGRRRHGRRRLGREQCVRTGLEDY